MIAIMLHVVGEHIERHLGCYSRKPFHEKVRCSHPALDSAERMFCRLTTHCHLFWMMIETCLHSLKHGFVLPSGDQSFLAGGAATLDSATLTGVGPVARKTKSLSLVVKEYASLWPEGQT